MSARPVSTPVDDDDLSDMAATLAEVRAMFEESARYYLDMTGDEFIAAWRSGRWPDPDGDEARGLPYEPGVAEVAWWLPFLGVAG